jgi:hypothetical protein
LGIADDIFQAQLFQDARFACVSVFATSRAIGADANLQKSAGEGGVIAKIGGVKLQKSAGIFAIMSVTLSGFGKELWNELGKSL